MYESSKTFTRQSNSKKIPLVYKSSHVYTESAEYTKPHKRCYLARPPSHVPGQWPQPVARGQGSLYLSKQDHSPIQLNVRTLCTIIIVHNTEILCVWHIKNIVAKAHMRANAIHRCFFSKDKHFLLRAHLVLCQTSVRTESLRVGSENMENLMTVVDRLDELQASSVCRRECSTRKRTGARRMDVNVDTYSQPCPRAIDNQWLWPLPRHMLRMA